MNVAAKTLLIFLLLGPVALHSVETGLLLKPPGLRPVSEPSIVMPAEYRYANRRLTLPHYRDAQGNPSAGWSHQYVSTRRFHSDQSAWLYYRNQDLRHSVIMAEGWDGGAFTVWPGGTIMVIESYQGNALNRRDAQLIEIAVISKADKNRFSAGNAFLPIEWSYGRFTAAGEPTMDDAKIRECHQCHTIAFHLTGDLVFTHLNR